jgi:hypothetical protein
VRRPQRISDDLLVVVGIPPGLATCLSILIGAAVIRLPVYFHFVFHFPRLNFFTGIEFS